MGGQILNTYYVIAIKRVLWDWKMDKQTDQWNLKEPKNNSYKSMRTGYMTEVNYKSWRI